ncbi:hypothetical protein C4D60_Mb05t21340 [Musa balbisiana]|uniref:DUF1308 domain-containing protein n=1 Tax=Musa balbisiana TaxID=52838 RepID=A0A4S8JXT7_MUSBA|nr:hypothetical protein C4D60_Mb05t21340 [Musa balbisiana]
MQQPASSKIVLSFGTKTHQPLWFSRPQQINLRPLLDRSKRGETNETMLTSCQGSSEGLLGSVKVRKPQRILRRRRRRWRSANSFSSVASPAAAESFDERAAKSKWDPMQDATYAAADAGACSRSVSSVTSCLEAGVGHFCDAMGRVGSNWPRGAPCATMPLKANLHPAATGGHQIREAEYRCLAVRHRLLQSGLPPSSYISLLRLLDAELRSLSRLASSSLSLPLSSNVGYLESIARLLLHPSVRCVSRVSRPVPAASKDHPVHALLGSVKVRKPQRILRRRRRRWRSANSFSSVASPAAAESFDERAAKSKWDPMQDATYAAADAGACSRSVSSVTSCLEAGVGHFCDAMGRVGSNWPRRGRLGSTQVVLGWVGSLKGNEGHKMSALCDDAFESQPPPRRHRRPPNPRSRVPLPRRPPSPPPVRPSPLLLHLPPPPPRRRASLSLPPCLLLPFPPPKLQRRLPRIHRPPPPPSLRPLRLPPSTFGLRARVERVIAAARSAGALKPASVLFVFSRGIRDHVSNNLVDEFGAVEVGLLNDEEDVFEELEDGWIGVRWSGSSNSRVFEVQIALDDGRDACRSLEVVDEREEVGGLDDGFGSLVSRIDVDSADVVNFDTTALIAMVSGISNGGCERLMKAPEAEMLARFKSNYEFVMAQVASELEHPILAELSVVMAGKKGIICQSVLSEFQELVSMCGGPNERLRADQLIKHLQVVPDSPSERLMNLSTTRKIALKNKIVFGTGDHWHAPTLTANTGFVRAVSQTSMSLLTIEHRPRALTGD